MTPLIPIWAGVECTLNRVGDRWIHQCEKSGHDKRLQDLTLFRELGVERIRYPFLWESAARANGEFDWSWADERAAELRRLDLKPIAGLLHHGSGPRHTHLLDPHFPYLFAQYARKFAERFPWIEDYTPINEPLTTARFSALYGHWYPHAKSDESFTQALLHQIKASILAMRAIRRINPRARWIQTEDMGRIQGTDLVQDQVTFENNRRWLSFDLLCGKMSQSHPLFSYLEFHARKSQTLQWCLENAQAPDVLGLNHYLLSNRYLDHRLEYYPSTFHGGNGRIRYADVGVVETQAARQIKPEELFQEVWERYRLPLAITEVHARGFREDQMAWLQEIRQAALNLKSRGVDVKAVTAWSLLGTFDWNSLCTQENGFYESGVFDLRALKPRPTALAKMIQTWNRGRDFHHPVLQREAWWKKSDQAPFGPRTFQTKPQSRAAVPAPPVLITGGMGTLGQAFVRVCQQRNIPFRATSRREMDIVNIFDVQRKIRELRPWAVINAAGFVRVDDAENEKQKCFRENVIGPENLAKVCAEENIPLLHFSSDLVFDGNQRQPYTESHQVGPLSTYGKSKAESERRVLKTHHDSLIIRASSFFGPWDQSNFVFQTLETLRCGQFFNAASDVVVSPTYIPDLVHLSLELLIDREKGMIHLANEGHLSWADLAGMTAKMAPVHHGPLHGSVQPKPLTEMNFKAPRPVFSALSSERVKNIMPSFEDALARYFRELEMPFTKRQNYLESV